MSAGGSGHDDEVAHDAMLRAALRHAPDRAAAPPEAVQRAILTAAREAVAPRRAGWLARVVAALGATLRQPAAGAAFASLMLGTLVLLMWQDGPPPAPERHAERAVQPQQQQPQPAAPAEAASGPAVDAAAVAAAQQTPAVDAAKRENGAAGTAAATAPQARGERQLAKQSATPTPPAPARRRAPVESADRAGGPSAESAAAAGAAAAAPSPATAAAPAPEPDPLAAVLAALSAARTEVAALERRAVAPPPRAAAAKATADEPRRADAEPSAWLGELRASARGRWQRVDAPAPSDAKPVRTPDGALLGRIAIEGDAVVWQPADAPGQAWRATLPPEALARLRAALSARP